MSFEHQSSGQHQVAVPLRAGASGTERARLLAGLLERHAAERARILELAALVTGELGAAIGYFIEGNAGDVALHRKLYLDKLFRREGALNALDAHYWAQMLLLTGLEEVLPEAARAAWRAQLSSWRHGPSTMLPFTPVNVRDTLEPLWRRREEFFGAKVAGVFNGLSRRHRSNAAQGFARRLVVKAYDAYGSTDLHAVGLVGDLRAVIAILIGRDAPQWRHSERLLRQAREAGSERLEVDGGALTVRAFQAGTLHITLHPDIAAQLNAVLHQARPNTLPAPRQGARGPTPLYRDVLPFAVLDFLDDATVDCSARTITLPDSPCDDSLARQARQALRRLGGAGGPVRFHFTDDPHPALVRLLRTGRAAP